MPAPMPAAAEEGGGNGGGGGAMPQPVLAEGVRLPQTGKGAKVGVLPPPPPPSSASAEGDSATPAASTPAAAAENGPVAQKVVQVHVDASAATTGAASITEVKLPLDVNTRVDCRWKDGNRHVVRIIERRKQVDSEDYDYYVHYQGLNRRMDEWVRLDQLDLSTVEVEDKGDKSVHKRRRADEDGVHDDEEHGDFDPNALREHEEFTKVKNIERVELGKHEMTTWYFSPFPPEYSECKKLYFCEFSLEFFKRRSQMLRRIAKCRLRHPPGEEVYRKGNISMFEVDGKKEKTYCQNLCYLAKLFLDHKTLYYDVDLFLFYIMCEIDDQGAHIVGYFSKEKQSEEGYNLACILTLPAYQRKGYGKFLISMSYELSKIEGKVGTPERPLSDLGLVSYRGYWTRVLLHVLREHTGTISIKELSDATAIKTEDIIQTLNHLNLIQYQKGQHVLCASPRLIEKYLREAGSPGLEVESARIIWTPYNAEREYANYRA